MPLHNFRIVAVGDSCLSIVFEEKIDLAVNQRCVAVALALGSEPDIRDVVPGYHTVAVYFDPLRISGSKMIERLESIASRPATATEREAASLIEIPVRYGGDSGADLAAVADFAGCPEGEVVKRHTEPEYRVYMLGFLPGFAYLGTVDRSIAMPRLESPRMRVKAGSVGIAGIQTGIYPCDTPGGWRIIGRTDIKPFDAGRDRPFLFEPGMRVKFVAA